MYIKNEYIYIYILHTNNIFKMMHINHRNFIELEPEAKADIIARNHACDVRVSHALHVLSGVQWARHPDVRRRVLEQLRQCDDFFSSSSSSSKRLNTRATSDHPHSTHMISSMSQTARAMINTDYDRKVRQRLPPPAFHISTRRPLPLSTEAEMNLRYVDLHATADRRERPSSAGEEVTCLSDLMKRRRTTPNTRISGFSSIFSRHNAPDAAAERLQLTFLHPATSASVSDEGSLGYTWRGAGRLDNSVGRYSYRSGRESSSLPCTRNGLGSTGGTAGVIYPDLRKHVSLDFVPDCASRTTVSSYQRTLGLEERVAKKKSPRVMHF